MTVYPLFSFWNKSLGLKQIQNENAINYAEEIKSTRKFVREHVIIKKSLFVFVFLFIRFPFDVAPSEIAKIKKPWITRISILGSLMFLQGYEFEWVEMKP